MKQIKYSLSEIEKLSKPKLVPIIFLTLICLGPYGNLIVDILNQNYYKILINALLTFPTLILATLSWCWYIYSKRTYKKLAKEIYDKVKH